MYVYMQLQGHIVEELYVKIPNNAEDYKYFLTTTKVSLHFLHNHHFLPISY